MVFLFETQERHSTFHISELDPDQKQAEIELLAWIKQLAGIYGRLDYSKEVFDFLEDWNKQSLAPAKAKAHPRMAEYFSRKKVNMTKLAIGIHFSENQDLMLTKDCFIKSISMFDSIEQKMQVGLGLTGRNELHPYVQRIKLFIENRQKVSEKEVIIYFAVDMNVSEIQQAIEQLIITGEVKDRKEKGIGRILMPSRLYDSNNGQ
jgi:hypothetical protein